MKVLLAVFLVSSVILSSQIGDSAAYLGPPLKQVQAGTEPSDVTCGGDLELVLKLSDGQPACIRPSSVGELVERGWAVHVLPGYEKSARNNSAIFTTGGFDVDAKVIRYLEGTDGYLAKPAEGGSFPGIVMIHEWWGLNDNIKEMAEKLASHGYVVLAVDLYEGQVATTPEEARQLLSSFDREEWVGNMNSAAAYLDERYAVTGMGSIGWCLGGGQSLQLALNNDGIDATVIYYGGLVTEADALAAIQWPVLGIFAELDQGIPPEQVAEFESALNELGISNDIHVYPGVDHAFANPSGDRYAPDEATDAWQKTLEFFEANLEQSPRWVPQSEAN